MQTTRPAVVGHLIPGPTGAASSYGGQAASSASGGYSASAAAVRPAANRQGTLVGLGAQVRRLNPLFTASTLYSKPHRLAETPAMLVRRDSVFYMWMMTD